MEYVKDELRYTEIGGVYEKKFEGGWKLLLTDKDVVDAVKGKNVKEARAIDTKKAVYSKTHEGHKKKAKKNGENGENPEDLLMSICFCLIPNPRIFDASRKRCWTKISNENAPEHAQNSRGTALDRYMHDRMIRIQQSKSSTLHPDSVVDKPDTISKKLFKLR
ncbi:hypothetical protein ACET3Z_013235 [Daucus carota]